MVIRQLKYQALKAMDAISNTVSWQFYGFSTGYACQTTTVATGTSGRCYTLANAFGVSALGNAAYLASMFTVNDRVALIRTGALVTNAIGQITAVDATNGTITVTWNGSVTSASGDNIVFANSVENTTIAGTDYNLAPVGLLDADDLHVRAWPLGLLGRELEPALTELHGGPLLRPQDPQGAPGDQNLGGGKPDLVIWSQGIENDVIEAEKASARFSSTFGMELDGSVKAKGITFFSSRKVPARLRLRHGQVDAVGKYTLLPKPDFGVPAWDEGDKMENRNALQFSIDFPYTYVWKSRANMAYYSGQTEL
jgi:hypothetical protein